VHVPEGVERAVHRFVDETKWPVHFDNAGGESQPRAKMPAFEGHAVAEFEQARRSARLDHAFRCECGRCAMHIYVSGQVEAALYRRLDFRPDDNSTHGMSAGIIERPARISGKFARGGHGLLRPRCQAVGSLKQRI
jgi:hypothetical protein